MHYGLGMTNKQIDCSSAQTPTLRAKQLIVPWSSKKNLVLGSSNTKAGSLVMVNLGDHDGLALSPSQTGPLVGFGSATTLKMTRFGRNPPWI